MKFVVVLQNKIRKGKRLSMTLPRPYKQLDEAIKFLNVKESNNLDIVGICLTNGVNLQYNSNDIFILNKVAYKLSVLGTDEIIIALKEAYSMSFEDMANVLSDFRYEFYPNMELKDVALEVSNREKYKNWLCSDNTIDICRIAIDLYKNDYFETSTGVINLY